MRVYENRLFERFDYQAILPWQKGRIFEDMEFRRCRFENCTLARPASPAQRSTVRSVRLIDCELNVDAYAVMVEDTLVSGLKARELVQTWGVMFKHVTLTGRIDRVMFSALVSPTDSSSKRHNAFLEAYTTYYASVDWALDISEAEFEEADLRGVPGHLVRRDPATQVLITRERALEGRWRDIDLSGTYWPTAIEFFLKARANGGWESSVVLVAPKRAPSFQRMLDGLKALRDAGVAEPD